MKIHCRVNLVVKIENPSSNLLEICSYISSFLHCLLVQTKTSFLLELTWQKWFSITYKSNMKTIRQSFQMMAHCLFTSIDSNENPDKYECGSLRVKIFERFYTPVWERTGKWKISGISSFVRESPAQNGRVGRYAKYKLFVFTCH
jgi:hypothetical protein